MTSPRVALDHWRALQAVVDHGGYAQAAAHLHRSQSSVSYAVAKLQEQLGISLLQVEGRKARLTEAGKVLLRRSRRLVSDAIELEQLAAGIQEGWETELQLAVDAVFPTDMLIAALKEFAPLSRGCRVQLKEVVLSGADDALVDGDADLVIGYRVPEGFLGDPIVEIEFAAVAHPDHSLHRLGRQLTYHDLIPELQVVIRDSGIHQKRDEGWLGSDHRWTVTSIETSVTTICNGLGFGWLPRHRIRDKLQQGLLKLLPLREGRVRKGYLYMMIGKSGNAGPAAHQLAEIFKRVADSAKV